MSVSPGTTAANAVAPHATPGSPADAEGDDSPQEQPPPQKRKGGRKPIYTTSEERKQRNRQAQAAFRERRTEYIKQLEIKIAQTDEALQALRQSQRSAAEECHLLRHRNSLLERILAEKGFDVQVELLATGSSPISRPQHASPVSSGASVVQQAIMNSQQQARRHPPVSSKNEPKYNPPSIQTLRLSPTSPSSSSLSSPTMPFYESSKLDGTSGSQHPQPHSFPHSRQPLQSQYVYSSFPGPPLGHAPMHGSDQQRASTDIKYSHGGVAGYHTPTSIDDNQPSRQSSLAQTAILNLGKLTPPRVPPYAERELPFPSAGNQGVGQYTNGMSFYGNPSHHQSMQQQPALYPPQPLVVHRPENYAGMHSTGTYQAHIYDDSQHSLNSSNRQPNGEAYGMSASMRYPSQYAYDSVH